MPLLSLIIWLPIAGGVWVLYKGAQGDEQAIRKHSLGITTATFILSLLLYSGFDTTTHTM